MIEAKTRKAVIGWVREDLGKNPYRFLCEAIGMSTNFAACIWMALTSPTPPMFNIYILFLIATFFLLGCAISRGSTFFTLMYVGFLIIDGIGFYNAW